MINFIIKKIVGSKNQREIKRMMPIVRQINTFEEQYQSLPDEELRRMTAEWKARISAIKDDKEQQKALDQILPEAFAMVKNTARRLCGRHVDVVGHPIEWQMIHFDVQLIGGMVLHSGRIAEMATGEGKTLVATLPLYLNALAGRGAHLITVNDYLARRDAEWIGEIYRFLGLTVGVIQHDQPPNYAGPNTPATSLTGPIASSASITCGTMAWPRPRNSRSSAVITSPSSTKWIPSSLTKPALR